MGKIYALLVGINEYLHPDIPTLSGCVKDVQSIQSVLESVFSADQREIITLENSGAKKQDIVDNVQAHLGKADEGDTALLYFSGHGCQEEMHEAFSAFKQGKKGESLLCHDSLKGASPLADLEIRYLLKNLEDKTKARILFITDACNSGGVSRDMTKAQKRLGPFAPKREFKDFIFPSTYETDLKTKNLEDLLPQAKHVHLAACESHQSAFELPGQQGIYTAKLVQSLEKSQGKVSLFDLHRNVRFILRHRFFQSPEMYLTSPGNVQETDLMGDEAFVGGPAQGPDAFAVATYANGKWRLDRGGIHGLVDKEGYNEISVLDPATGAELTTGTITSIGPAISTFRPASRRALDRKNESGYKAKIKTQFREPLYIQYSGNDGPLQNLTSDSAYVEQLTQYNIQEVSDRSKADYLVIAFDKGFVIASPLGSDNPENARAVTAAIVNHDQSARAILGNYLSKIAHWHFVKGLHNPAPKQAIVNTLSWQVDITPANAKREVKIVQGKKKGKWVDIEMEPTQTHTLDKQQTNSVDAQLDHEVIEVSLPQVNAPKKPIVYVSVKLANASDAPLYVSLIYVGSQFDVSSRKVLETEVMRLEAKGDANENDSTRAFKSRGVKGATFSLAPFIKDFNWMYQRFFFKVIISNTPFELNGALNQKRLPAPDKDLRNLRGSTPTKLEAVTNDPSIKDWAAKMVEVRFKNPDYTPPA